jgi:hypothetical protein
VSTKLPIQEKEMNTQAMLCPCCGGPVFRRATECSCGARFVGEPLDETPIQVQRLGPAMTSVALLLLVIAASLIATKWFALASVFVIWSARRATKLARQDAEWYGGYKTAAVTLTLTLAGALAMATYGIAHIPKAIENYRTREIAATQASMHHIASILEDYRVNVNHGASYPNPQQFKVVMGGSLPADYWDSSIKYQPRTDPVADKDLEITGLSNTSFELRSAGPDGVIDTDDDIIMRDGVFFTNAELKKKTVVQQLR